MIDIYTEKKESKDWILQNDLYFNLNEVSELGDLLIYQNEKGDTKVDVYGELDEESTCKEFLQVQTEGTRQWCERHKIDFVEYKKGVLL